MTVKERVLIVDDDDILLNMMSLSLTRHGYTVKTALDGPTALELIRTEEPYAVMLTDMMMPVMSGTEVLREARQIDPHLESIVITAAGTLESAIASLRFDGAYDYLLKPLESINHLVVAIDRAASHRQLILEKEALQATIQEEAEWLQALIANTSDAILAADAEGYLKIVNPSACRLIDPDNPTVNSHPEIIGTPAVTSLPLPLARLIKNWQAVNNLYPAVIEIPWVDGSTQMVNLTPVFDEAHHYQGWVMVLRDISHLKNIDDLKARMLSDAVHKIQMPLAQAVTDLAELNWLAGQDQRVASIIYRLTKVWKSIQDWGVGLSDMVKIDTAPTMPQTEVNLQSLLEDICRNLDLDILKFSGIKVDLQMASDFPPVVADKDLLCQLLEALIRRAARRTPPNGSIRVQARIQDDQAWIDVSDSGPVVSQADLPHLFEKSSINIKTELINVGLELAKVKTIMDRMGGQVWIGGEGPIGSSIIVCLPLTAYSGTA